MVLLSDLPSNTESSLPHTAGQEQVITSGQHRFGGRDYTRMEYEQVWLTRAALEIAGMGAEGEVTQNQRASWIAVTLNPRVILNMHKGAVSGTVTRSRGGRAIHGL